MRRPRIRFTGRGRRLPLGGTAIVTVALAAGIAVVLASGLPLRTGVLVAALTGIAAGLLLERPKA
jgi:hydrogenase/urease accessory protein HupE